ncbi:MAG: T9SS type A sorting domain-containing protein [Chitinophagales bacterium]|nr:T9SS type A sorting domain-containing protein [Chitinophagales bacterium]
MTLFTKKQSLLHTIQTQKLAVGLLFFFTFITSLLHGQLNGIDLASNGDILITNTVLKSVIKIDPMTGDQTIISDSNTGTGVALEAPIDIAEGPDGMIVVVDSMADALIKIDPATGNRTILSDAATGGGPEFQAPSGISLDDISGLFLVTDADLKAVFTVNNSSGARVIYSQDGVTGTGPAFAKPLGLNLSANDFVVVDNELDAVIRVSLFNHNRSMLSDANMGTGPVFDAPIDIAIEASTNFVVADLGSLSVIRVDKTTGDRTTVSGNGVGVGPGFESIGGIIVEADGNILVVDPGLEAILRVDPVTGDRALLSTVTDVEELDGTLSLNNALTQSYPNPFSGSTNIEFELTKQSHVTLQVFDEMGKEVAILINNELGAGNYRIPFEAENLTNGVYYYQFTADGLSEVKQLVLIK